MSHRSVLMALPLLALVACGDAGDEPAAAPDATAVTPGAEAPPPTSATPPAARSVALDPEGLRLVSAQTGATAVIAFGQPAEQVASTVSGAQGKPPAERGTNGECGAGPLDFATWDDGLTLWFQNGAFAGWATNRPGPTLISGVGVGSSRSDLEGAHAIEVREGSLGTEFSFGDVHGVLEDGRVANLWAGVSCNFG